MKTFFCQVFGLLFIASVGQAGHWSKWKPCSKTCGNGTQIRTLDCSSMRQHTQVWRDCINNKEIQTRNCQKRTCTDFALKCFQCKGLEDNCLRDKLKRNRTKDACNQYSDRCIIKTFMLDIGVTEVTRGCGMETECRLEAKDCRRKRSSHYRCHVTCCEEDYCNSSNQIFCRVHASIIFLMCGFLSAMINLQ